MNWSDALVIDFTGSLKTDEKSRIFSFERFNKEVIELIRNQDQNKLGIIFDTAFSCNSTTPNIVPSLVKDHINLSGDNPLIGPNFAGGERFPPVQDIYVYDCAEKVTQSKPVIIAGLKYGKKLSSQDAELIGSLGASCYCYNTVATMITAAHVKWKLLSVVGPQNSQENNWQSDCLTKIKQLATCAK